MLFEIGIILFLIICNGLFSMSEIAVVSSRKSRLEHEATRGNKSAKQALELANSPNRFLSTVQIGITLIGILTGVFGGAAFAQIVARYIALIPLLAPYSSAIGLFIVVLIITFFSLVIGELVPKRIGLNNPEPIAKLVAAPMNIISKITSPLVWLLSQSTELILRIFNLKPSAESPVTEEEVVSLIAQGAHVGTFEEVEQDIVERVFALSDRKATSIMTNKLDIDWLDIHDDFEVSKEIVLQSTYSSFPVCNETLDDVIGILNTKTFLQAILKQEKPDIRSMLEKPLFVPEGMQAFRVLEKLKETRLRMAIVIDEFGAVQGLITLRDLFEAMVGDLERPIEEEAEIVMREDGSYLVDALIPIEEFTQYFEIASFEPEEKAGFHTLGGLIINIARQIPKTGEKFEWKNVSFEIMDMDGNRIDKVLVVLKS